MASACAGGPQRREVAAGMIVDAAASIGDGFLLLGHVADHGSSVAWLDPGARGGARPLRHPFARTARFRGVTALPRDAGLLICVESPAGTAALVPARIADDRSEISAGDRIALPAGESAVPRGLGSVTAADRTFVVLGYAGEGPAAGQLRWGELTADGTIAWRSAVHAFRAPLTSPIDATAVTDCVAIHADRSGAVRALATWAAPADTGSVVFTVARPDARGELTPLEPPVLIWTGYGLLLSAIAGDPSGGGILGFGEASPTALR